ncbi:TasA family protein [Clostridium sp. D33t1_170424_F3]|uniref:TasA family protein n=1 Tax=Clostridium sp. D33t1_170424_F3 TaxID=2787099 RepID=UPI0018ABF46A|nr:TasA family protein [Clostridium sp. D33t1_170424_F3]
MKKRRLLLSLVSVLLVFCLAAGGTMAWFSDTEKIGGNFSAGVLDITLTPGEMTSVPLTFQNLRPMDYEDFKAEINAAGNGNRNTEGYVPVPQYFQPIVVKNVGTLPVLLTLSAEELNMAENRCPGDGEEKITLGEAGNPGKVDWDKTGKNGTCTNGLADVLKLVLFEKIDDVWTVVADNLNPDTEGEPYAPEIILPAATGTKTYVVGAYLPGETTGNESQGKHYHGNLVANAVQTDGSEIVPEPEFPRVVKSIDVKWYLGPQKGEIEEVIYTTKIDVVFEEESQLILFDLRELVPPEGYLWADRPLTIYDRDYLEIITRKDTQKEIYMRAEPIN